MNDRGSGPTESAAELATRLGSSLPDPADLDPAAFALVEAARDLVEAIVSTALSGPERAAAASELALLSTRLNSSRRDPAIIVARHSDGRIENLTQAGSGRLNPQGLPLVFDHVPSPPDQGSAPQSVEITARCVLTAAHSGPPDRIHGGVAATLLDEVLGIAATAAGATGMTGTIEVRYHAPTPYGTELEARGRYTHSEGRKHYATGELIHAGQVTASATAIYVSARPAPQ
jgi:acyl-coenzyme A thioesterase PaaI-like protein